MILPVALASTWSVNCWGLESVQRKDPNERVDPSHTLALTLAMGSRWDKALGWVSLWSDLAGNSLGVWAQPVGFLVSICKAAPTTYSSQARENQLLLSERGLALLLVTGAGTTIFPIPVLVALGQLERESLSVPVCSGKFLGFFFGKQHVLWNVKNVPVWISTRCCWPVQPCFTLEHGQNGTDLQYISWVTYDGWVSFSSTAM